MASRLAFFVPKEITESFFNLEVDTDTLLEPHYNLTPGYRLPVVYRDGSNNDIAISKVRWGESKNGKTANFNISAGEVVSVLKSNDTIPCVLPASGYYMWRGNDEKGQPFFVRLLNSQIMAVAGLYHRSDAPFVQMITTEANTLIQPMSDNMPLILNKAKSKQWLETPEDTEQFLKESRTLYLLTDYSVLKISKKVNDPSNNNPELIQPIPK